MNFDCTFSTFLVIVMMGTISCVWSSPVPGNADTRPEPDPLIEGAEKIAKLLIDLDQSIEKAMQSEAAWNHLYVDQPGLNNTTGEENGDKEEKFSAVLQDLTKIEEQIKDAINNASSPTSRLNYRLVMRLRPLLGYVQHIHRNMEMLRTRVVAIATLSNLGQTITEVLDQFGDAMTSSLGLGGIVPPNNKNRVASSTVKPTQGSESASVASSTSQDAPTTLSYTEVDSENYLKNIINQVTK